mmetsp:Transcript_21789/g.36040  ORF Transcript_21789/g.36040 Transcript_21789/m.36040 type:complete len:406 (+) Transcript_21789:63-1280(+)
MIRKHGTQTMSKTCTECSLCIQTICSKCSKFLLLFACIVHFAALSVAESTADPELKYSINIQHPSFGQPLDTYEYTNGPNITMVTKSGEKFVCFLPTPTTEAAPAQTPEPTPTIPFAKALKKLKNKCLDLKKGYWTYEVCPFASVKQYHQEGNNKSPLFSLGTYDASRDEEWDESGTYSQHFGDGTGDRKSIVTFRCGDEEQNHRILNVEEPARLTYQFDVITPFMCRASDKDSSARASANRSPSQLLEKLRGSPACLSRTDGWWTYEFCYGKHVVQFHQMGDARTMEQHNVLGVFDVARNRELDRNGTNIVNGSTSTYYFQQYSNGSVCELPESTFKTVRSAVVRFECNRFNNKLNLIKSVEEESTCKYVVTVLTPFLCGHQAFKSADLLQQVNCVPASALTSR